MKIIRPSLPIALALAALCGCSETEAPAPTDRSLLSEGQDVFFAVSYDGGQYSIARIPTGMGVLNVPVGSKAVVVEDPGPEDDLLREVRLGVDTPEYQGSATAFRKYLRPAKGTR